VLAAILAAAAGVVGISSRDETEGIGPKVLTLHKVGRFHQPVALAQPPGVESPLFIVERPGVVRVIADGMIQAAPFLDLRGKVKHSGKGGEQGTLSIAFPQDYSKTDLFYVSYTDHMDALRVVEYHADPNDPFRADPASARPVLSIPEPTTKHHGGQLLFGPDGYLYIGSGDGGPSGDPRAVAQSKRSLLGKILRIDPKQGEAPPPRPSPKKAKGKGGKGKKRPPKPLQPPPYTIPPDNPFVGRPGRDEIFAYGLRNPWRFSFDRAEDRLAIGDVGDIRFEEVNVLPTAKALGANFGWSAFEGNAPLKDGVPRDRTVKPTYVYPHGRRCSIVGGYIVRDPRLSRIKGREIVGRYVFGDFCAERIFAFRFLADKIGKERKLHFELPGVTSFGEDRSGRIYVLTYGAGRERGFVYRLDATRKPAE
jgi:hypothetical protein